jgi:hypothetical protein
VCGTSKRPYPPWLSQIPDVCNVSIIVKHDICVLRLVNLQYDALITTGIFPIVQFSVCNTVCNEIPCPSQPAPHTEPLLHRER